METRSSTLANDFIVAEGPAGWMVLETAESRTAAEVVMDDALVQDDGINLIVEELDDYRKGILRDTEGRQNGNDLPVLRGTEEAYHLAKNDYSFDALQTNCFGINIKL